MTEPRTSPEHPSRPFAQSLPTSNAQLMSSSPLRAWGRSHAYSLLSSLGRFLRAPLSHLLTLGVLALALALPAMGVLSLKNLRSVSSALAQPGDISLFLRPEVSLEAAERLQTELKQATGIAKILLKSPEQGLAEFRDLTRFSDALELLDENPLPAVLVISLEKEMIRSGAALQLVEQLRAVPEVEIVQFDQEWLARLKAMMALAERLVLAFGGLLALTVLLVIGNTIRLEIAARADEIQIVRLVGASNAFVRRPFLYSGFWFGMFGALLAVLLVTLSARWLSPAVSEFALSYSSAFKLQGLSWAESLLLIGFGAGLGWLGALIASAQHLARSETPQ